MLFSARYHFIPFEWLSRRSEPRNSTRSKPDITPWISFSNLAINCCMAFLLWSCVADLDIQQRTPSEERQVFVCGLPLCGAGWQAYPPGPAGWQPAPRAGKQPARRLTPCPTTESRDRSPLGAPAARGGDDS